MDTNVKCAEYGGGSYLNFSLSLASARCRILLMHPAAASCRTSSVEPTM